MAPRMQVLDPGSRAGDFPHKWEGGGMGEGADVSNTQVVTQLVGFPCRSWSFVNTPSILKALTQPECQLNLTYGPASSEALI